MFTALHIGRRPDEKKRVMITRAGGTQKRSDFESVRDLETETVDIEAFRSRNLGHEADDVRKCSRLRRHVLPDADLVYRAVRRRSWRVDDFAWQIQWAPLRHL